MPVRSPRSSPEGARAAKGARKGKGSVLVEGEGGVATAIQHEQDLGERAITRLVRWLQAEHRSSQNYAVVALDYLEALEQGKIAASSPAPALVATEKVALKGCYTKILNLAKYLSVEVMCVLMGSDVWRPFFQEQFGGNDGQGRELLKLALAEVDTTNVYADDVDDMLQWLVARALALGHRLPRLLAGITPDGAATLTLGQGNCTLFSLVYCDLDDRHLAGICFLVQMGDRCPSFALTEGMEFTHVHFIIGQLANFNFFDIFCINKNNE